MRHRAGQRAQAPAGAQGAACSDGEPTPDGGADAVKTAGQANGAATAPGRGDGGTQPMAPPGAPPREEEASPFASLAKRIEARIARATAPPDLSALQERIDAIAARLDSVPSAEAIYAALDTALRGIDRLLAGERAAIEAAIAAALVTLRRELADFEGRSRADSERTEAKLVEIADMLQAIDARLKDDAAARSREEEVPHGDGAEPPAIDLVARLEAIDAQLRTDLAAVIGAPGGTDTADPWAAPAVDLPPARRAAAD